MNQTRSGCQSLLGDEDERDHDVPDDEDREIRRRVVGAMVMQFLMAMRAGVGHLEKLREHRALAAGRTTHEEAAQHGVTPRAISFDGA